MDGVYAKTTKFLGSRLFFWLVIAFFVLEALWIALSFRYPMLYDEVYHFSVTKIYSHQLLPFITNQPQAYDQFGSLSHSNSVLYHYLLSFPYRFIAHFTPSLMFQVISLRLLNIAMAATGLWLFGTLLRKLGTRQVYVNLGLLVFALLPITPFVAATINYDNMLFLVTALYLIFGLRVLRSRNIQWFDYVALVTIGCFASLVKFTFLPIFVVTIVFTAIVAWRRHRSKFWGGFKKSMVRANRWVVVSMGVVASIIIALFLATYVQNLVRYKTPNPTCDQTLSVDRCMKKNAYARNVTARETKNERPAEPLPQYTYKVWLDYMVQLTNWSGNTVDNRQAVKSGLPMMNLLVFFGSLAGVLVLVYAWRLMPRKDIAWYYLIAAVATLFLTVYLFNVRSYYALHAPYGDQPRYLLSVLPILITLIVAALAAAVRGSKRLKMLILIGAALVFTQGGGIISHIVLSEESWYWDNSLIRKANHLAQQPLRAVVKEGYGKYGF